MAQQVRKRFQKTVRFSSNNKQTEQLSRGMIYRELAVRLQHAPTLTIANNTAAKLKRGGEWAVVKRIDIVANNTDVIRSISGSELWWLNTFLFGSAPQESIALASDNPACDSILRIPFWQPRSIRPIDTALDARELSDLKIDVTWGTYTDVNGDATAWTTEPTLEVSSIESFGVRGPFSQWRFFGIEKEITATNPSFQVDLPVGPMYRGFMIVTIDADDMQSDILNNFKWISGTTVFADMKEKNLREEYIARNGIDRGIVRTGDFDGDNFDGVYMYDHVTDGYLSEAIDTLGFSEIKLELDVTVGSGTTKVIIYPQQIIPVRGKNNA